MARKMSMPPVSSTSSMLSRVQESEPLVDTSGRSSCMFGISGVSNLKLRATAQLRLPLMVLISPLWARNLNGWARRHSGQVLVEKR